MPALVFTVGGIAAGTGLKPGSAVVLTGFFAALAAAFLLVVPGRQWRGAAWQAPARSLSGAILFFFLGLGLACLQEPRVTNPGGSVAFTGMVSEVLSPGAAGWPRYRVSVSAIRKPEGWQPFSGQAVVRFSDTTALFVPGDRLLVKKGLRLFDAPAIPGQFDAQQYYARQGVHYMSYAGSRSWRVKGREQALVLYRLAHTVRRAVENLLLSRMPHAGDGGMLAALLLGVRRKMDPELKAAYAQAGISHILAVSGMHVGLIFGFFSFALGRLRYLPGGRLLLASSLIALLWMYALVTGLSPSVLRAVTVFSVLQLNTLLRRPALPVNGLCLGTFLLLLNDVNLIYDVGYQLSFAAVYGILSFGGPLRHLFRFRIRPLAWIWESCSVTLAATLSTFPVLVWHFHQFPVYFLPANLVAVPVSNGLLYSGIGLLVLSPWAEAARWAGEWIHHAISFLNGFVCWIGALPMASAGNLYLPLPALFFMLICLILAQISVVQGRRLPAMGSALAFLLMALAVAAGHHSLRTRPATLYAVRTRTDWMLAEMQGRAMRLHLLGDAPGTTVRMPEEKALQDGFGLLQAATCMPEGRNWTPDTGRGRAANRLWVLGGKTYMRLSRFPGRCRPACPVKIDVLILDRVGSRTLARALEFLQPSEIWADSYGKGEAALKETAAGRGFRGRFRNFRGHRFQTLARETGSRQTR